MRSKGNLNASYTTHLKATWMREYNLGIKNPIIKIREDLDLISVPPKLLEGGMGVGGMGTIIAP
jgi:hypothetical protein